jgi:sugar phosphate isomerase/epimerase
MAMKVGIQLYSIKTKMKEDPVAAIAKVADMGYKYLEGANHNALEDPGVGFPAAASELRKQAEARGSRFIGCHISPLQASNLPKVLAYHKALGTSYLINPARFFSSRDDVLRQCEEFNDVAGKCAEEGIAYLYHNHFHEFQRIDGEKTVLDLIVENTDPGKVGIQLDTYWAMRGGFDPVAVIGKYGSRIKILHQKDMPADLQGPVNAFEMVDEKSELTMEQLRGAFIPNMVVEIGTGCIDIQRIIDAAAKVTDIKYIVLEQDMTQLDEFESIQLSMNAFRKFSGIEWN